MKSRALASLLFLTVVGGTVWGYRKSVDGVEGFSLSNIHCHRLVEPRWHIDVSEKEIAEVRSILEQPFFYLARGRQSYAFVSQDGEYVLKFMKCQRLRVTPLYERMILPRGLEGRRQREIGRKREQREKLFSSYLMARKPLAEQTQTLFVHLNATPCLGMAVTLYDKRGRKHLVQIDEVPFALQRRAESVLSLLSKLLQQGDKEAVKGRLRQIVALIIESAKKGIRDADQSLIARGNLGFVDGQAMYIDIGSFKPLSAQTAEKMLKKDFESLRFLLKWLQTRDPDLASYLQQEIDHAVSLIPVLLCQSHCTAH